MSLRTFGLEIRAFRCASVPDPMCTQMYAAFKLAAHDFEPYSSDDLWVGAPKLVDEEFHQCCGPNFIEKEANTLNFASHDIPDNTQGLLLHTNIFIVA